MHKNELPVYHEFQVEPMLSLQVTLPEFHNHLQEKLNWYLQSRFIVQASYKIIFGIIQIMLMYNMLHYLRCLEKREAKQDN